VETAIVKLTKYELPGSDQIPALKQVEELLLSVIECA
jgi:hypothetical protein